MRKTLAAILLPVGLGACSGSEPSTSSGATADNSGQGIAPVAASVDGRFDGCQPGRMYALTGNLVLECLGSLDVRAEGPTVLVDREGDAFIGQDPVDAIVQPGQVLRTRLMQPFTGCGALTAYRLENGLVLACQGAIRQIHPAGTVVEVFATADGRQTTFVGGTRVEGQLVRMQ